MTEKRPTLSIKRKPTNPVSQGVPKADSGASIKPAAPLNPPKATKGTDRGAKSLTAPPAAPEQKKLSKAEVIAKKRAKKLRQGEAALPLLSQFWPALFPLVAPKPLKVGIKEDLVADAAERGLGMSRVQIAAALMVYINRPEYRSAVAQGGQRVDLHGLPAGEVDEKAVEHAKRKLAKLQRGADDGRFG